ncbi:hypothetical protein [Pleionea sediminis]|uniref:hypothetical protein n=1 Tax=Pleionea sediminis TaxID=2569479 RepID=UPI0011850F40|nr:hypothetical protein [Pleionea sediminis]
MLWYTNDKGNLCIGMDSETPSNIFDVETPLQTKSKVEHPVTLEHVVTIGSYPEDWKYDSHIKEKLTAAARLLFEEDLKEC